MAGTFLNGAHISFRAEYARKAVQSSDQGVSESRSSRVELALLFSVLFSKIARMGKTGLWSLAGVVSAVAPGVNKYPYAANQSLARSDFFDHQSLRKTLKGCHNAIARSTLKCITVAGRTHNTHQVMKTQHSIVQMWLVIK